MEYIFLVIIIDGRKKTCIQYFYFSCDQLLKFYIIIFVDFFRYAEYGTILEIKNLVLLNDGCSILSTVGVRRFRILSRGERDGYDTASIANVCDVSIPSNQIEGNNHFYSIYFCSSVLSW